MRKLRAVARAQSKRRRTKGRQPRRKPLLAPDALIRAVEAARADSTRLTLRVMRTQLRRVTNRPSYVRTAGALVNWARERGALERRLALKAILRDGEPAAVFVVQRISEMRR